MQTYNMPEAKTRLTWLIEQAAEGEPFVIAMAGKPLVKVVAINAPEISTPSRFGFMAGQIHVPEDFDRMGEDVIVAQFGDGT